MVVVIVHTVGHVVYLCDYEEEDSKAKFIENDVILNVEDKMLHETVIGNLCVSLTIMKSYQDDYSLFEPLTTYNPKFFLFFAYQILIYIEITTTKS